MTAAVEVKDVSKHFRLYHERYNTLKERLVHLGRQSYEQYSALRDVTLDLEEGKTSGLIGVNGSGKTTLLKIIAGILRPSSGTVKTKGRVAALLELGAGFHPDLTGRENVYMNSSILGLTRKETDRYFDDMVAFSELEKFIDNQVKHYSSGMYVRLGFAVAVHVNPQILLVDEVLSVGDEAFQRKCLARVRQFQKEGRTIVFVTHAVDLARAICDEAFLLDQGALIVQGSPSKVIDVYRMRVLGEDVDSFPEPGYEWGNRAIRITDVHLLNGRGLEDEVFASGEPLDVVFTLESQERVEDPVVGISIHDEEGNVIYGTNTKMMDIKVESLSGKARVRMHCSSIPLMDGSWRMGLAVHSRDEQTVYHRRERAFPFKIVNRGNVVGWANFGVDFEVEKL